MAKINKVNAVLNSRSHLGSVLASPANNSKTQNENVAKNGPNGACTSIKKWSKHRTIEKVVFVVVDIS